MPTRSATLFVQVLALLSAESLITLERVMRDGTRIRASAASREFRTKSRIEAHLAHARAAVTALETTSEEESSLADAAGTRASRRASPTVARGRELNDSHHRATGGVNHATR